MRKTLSSLVLGAALLVPCGSTLAGTNRPVEPRWGIRPEKAAPALLDFARWLSGRLLGASGLVDSEPEPEPAPNPAPDPGATQDATCPERIHCPIG